jgi:hypothetical protein
MNMARLKSSHVEFTFCFRPGVLPSSVHHLQARLAVHSLLYPVWKRGSGHASRCTGDAYYAGQVFSLLMHLKDTVAATLHCMHSRSGAQVHEFSPPSSSAERPVSILQAYGRAIDWVSEISIRRRASVPRREQGLQLLLCLACSPIF